MIWWAVAVMGMAVSPTPVGSPSPSSTSTQLPADLGSGALWTDPRVLAALIAAAVAVAVAVWGDIRRRGDAKRLVRLQSEANDGLQKALLEGQKEIGLQVQAATAKAARELSAEERWAARFAEAVQKLESGTNAEKVAALLVLEEAAKPRAGRGVYANAVDRKIALDLLDRILPPESSDV